jgi:hypothetical protein
MVGCANRSAALQESVENYVKALRRADPQVALSYVTPEKRPEFAKTFERIDQDLMMSNVEIKSVLPDEKMENAVVVFMMEFFDQNSANLVLQRTSSLWKFHEEAKTWLLESATPLVSSSN